MATTELLQPCKDCGHQVSKKAESCPNCGRQRPGGGVSMGVIILTGIIGVFIAVLLIHSASDAKQQMTSISNDLNGTVATSTP